MWFQFLIKKWIRITTEWISLNTADSPTADGSMESGGTP